MKIEHIAIWVKDLESMKKFYETYFSGKSGSFYHNPVKEFSSYFISFTEGCRLELMHQPHISEKLSDIPVSTGIIHFAISVGSKEQVDQLTERLRKDGYKIVSEPRTTGDGYYESVISDPEGNLIEITI